MKLPAKLIVLFLLLSLVPLALIGYLAYESSRQAIEQNTRSRLVSSTIFKKDELNRWLDSSSLQLRNFARRPHIKALAATLTHAGTTASDRQLARDLLRTEHFTPAVVEEAGFLELSLLDTRNGKILVSTRPGEEGLFRESEAYFIEGQKGTYVDDVRYALYWQQAVMYVSTPVKDEAGKLVAVLAGRLDPSIMTEIMLQESGLNPTEETYLVNSFNFFVTNPPQLEDDVALKKAIYTGGVQSCLAGNSGVGLYRNYGDVPVLAAYRWIPERKLCILTEVSQTEAFAPIYQLRTVMVGMGGLFAGLVALLGIFYARSITGPVLELLKGTEAVGQGDLAYRTPVTTRDEIGQLATAFNDMTAKRQQAESALQQAHDELELRVQERTQALHASEAELRALIEGMTDLVLVLDWDGRYLKVPQTNTPLLYKSAADLVGRTVTEALPPHLADDFLGRIRSVLETGRRGDIFEYSLPINGRQVWFSAAISPVLDNAVLWVARDITERKKAEDELHQLNQNLAQSNAELTILHEIGAQLAATLDPHQIYRVIFEKLGCELLQAPHFKVVVYNPKNQLVTCEFVIVDGQETDPAQYSPYELGAGPTSQTIRSREVVLVDLERERAALQQKNQNTQIGDEKLPKSSLHLPLLSGDRVIGVMNFQSYAAQAFDQAPLSLLATVASQVAAVLEKAKLFQTAHDYSVQLEAEIEERENTETALRASEERYRVLAEASPDMIFVINRDDTVAYVNSFAAKQFGGDAAQIIGQPRSRLFPPNVAIRQKQNLDRVFESGQPLSTEDKITFPGSELWLNTHLVPLRNETKEVTTVMGVSRDVTATKQAEEALAAAYAFRRAIEASMLSGVTVVDLEGRLVLVNQAFCNMVGWTEDELVGTTPPYIFWPPEEIESITAAFESDIGGRPHAGGIEVRFRRRNQERFEVLVLASPLRDRLGNITGLVGVVDDITERKQMQAALQASEERFRALIQNSSDLILIIDAKGIVQYASPAVETMLGYSPQELQNSGLFDYVHPQDLPALNEVMAGVLLGAGVTLTTAVRMRHKDGSWRILDGPGTNLLEHPAVRGIVINIRDITESKQAEEALRKSEEQYRLLADNTLDVIWTMGLDLNFSYVNPAIIQLTGHTPDEWIGSHLSDHCREAEFTKMVGVVGQEMGHGSNHNGVIFESEMLRKDGSPIPVEIRGTVIFDADGTPVQLQGTTRDITDRKQSEAALKESEGRYRSLFEDSPISLWEEDFSGVKQYLDQLAESGVTDLRRYFNQHPEAVEHCAMLIKIIDVNKQTLAIFGAAKKQVLLSNLPQVFTPESFETFQEQIITLGQGHLKFEAETTNKTLQGKVLYVSLRLSVPLQYEDDLSKVHLSISDITRRKQAEQALAHNAAELARSNEELEQFAYVASHDLQEPLRMVTSYLQLLERRYRDRFDEDAIEFIAYAVDGASRMKILITDLLAFSRVGTRGEAFAPTDMERVLGQVLLNLQVAINESEAKITHDPLPTILGDGRQLEQLLQNLISNALKFHGEQAPQIHVGVAQQDNQWRFEVQDNGIGLEPAYAEKVFVIFQRLHNREEYAGTGIGLAICKKIVERHGGRIWVESEPSKGSIFYFTLPANETNGFKNY